MTATHDARPTVRDSEIPPQENPTRRRLERKLGALRERGHLPAEMIDLVELTLEVQAESRSRTSAPLPQPGELPDVERNLSGVPLLIPDDFGYDRAEAAALLGRLLDAVADMGGHLGDAATRVREAVHAGELTPDDVFTASLRSDEQPFADWAERTPQAPRLLTFLARAALAPSIAMVAESLSERVPQGRSWAHGHCPVCGGLPYISVLKGKEGHRHLCCSFCQTSYRAPRLSCPYCDEDDADKLEYFDVKEEPGYRVEVCRSCNGYIKCADFRAMDRVSDPRLDDLESLALDVLAQQQGLARPTLSAWGF